MILTRLCKYITVLYITFIKKNQPFMKTPEEQAKEAEAKNKDLIARTFKVPAKPKAFRTFKALSQEKIALQQQWQAMERREIDIATLFLEIAGVEQEDVESFNLNEDTKEFVIITKSKDTPTTPNTTESTDPKMEVVKGDVVEEELVAASEEAVAELENHK